MEMQRRTHHHIEYLFLGLHKLLYYNTHQAQNRMMNSYNQAVLTGNRMVEYKDRFL